MVNHDHIFIKPKEIIMLTTRILPAMLAVAIMVSAGGAAFAADAPAAAPAEKAATVALTKQQIKDIKMACKKDSKGDKAAYKACVTDKKKAELEKAANPDTAK
jgi:hypothetical protein